jgi:hypothetical protein
MSYALGKTRQESEEPASSTGDRDEMRPGRKRLNESRIRSATASCERVCSNTSGCSSFLERAEYELCEVTLAQGQSWPSILASLDSLDIEILPDEATVIPPGRIGLDGVTMVVEVLAGSQYRTYSYWSPKANAPQPEVRRAAAILDAVSDIGYVK